MHLELSPLGLDVVTVALDTDVEAARPFHDAANATHPSLVDPALQLVGLFGMTNAPFGVWIDESGTIVRPAEVAFAPRQPSQSGQDTDAIIAQLPPEQRSIVEAMTVNMRDTDRYAAALRDWAAKGSESAFALSPNEVIERSRPRPEEFGLAAAHFDIAQQLHRTGHQLDAVPHFQEAHRLDPTNWSYHREALSLVDPAWGQVYERDMLSEVAAVGPETFYPPLDM